MEHVTKSVTGRHQISDETGHVATPDVTKSVTSLIYHLQGGRPEDATTRRTAIVRPSGKPDSAEQATLPRRPWEPDETGLDPRPETPQPSPVLTAAKRAAPSLAEQFITALRTEYEEKR